MAERKSGSDGAIRRASREREERKNAGKAQSSKSTRKQRGKFSKCGGVCQAENGLQHEGEKCEIDS